MIKKIFLLIALSLNIACSTSKNEDVLDKNTYKKILKEAILADILSSDSDKKNLSDKNFLSLVYNKYNIDSTSFKKTTDYYSNHPEILEEIYAEIEKEFKQKLDSLEPNSTPKPKTEKIKIGKKDIKIK